MNVLPCTTLLTTAGKVALSSTDIISPQQHPRSTTIVGPSFSQDVIRTSSSTPSVPPAPSPGVQPTMPPTSPPPPPLHSTTTHHRPPQSTTAHLSSATTSSSSASLCSTPLSSSIATSLTLSSITQPPVHAELVRCDLLWLASRRNGPITPVQGVELHPVVIIKDKNARLFDDDEISADNPIGQTVAMFYRWYRGPPRAVCSFHPHVAAKLQCTVTLRCFCSYDCFARGHRQLHRFYVSQGQAPIPPHPNSHTYGVPCRAFNWDDLDSNKEFDEHHYRLLKQAHLLTLPHEQRAAWTLVSSTRNYVPTSEDLGHHLRLETLLLDIPPHLLTAKHSSGATASPSAVSCSASRSSSTPPNISKSSTASSSSTSSNLPRTSSSNKLNVHLDGPSPLPDHLSLPSFPVDMEALWSSAAKGFSNYRVLQTGCCVPAADYAPRQTITSLRHLGHHQPTASPRFVPPDPSTSSSPTLISGVARLDGYLTPQQLPATDIDGPAETRRKTLPGFEPFGGSDAHPSFGPFVPPTSRAMYPPTPGQTPQQPSIENVPFQGDTGVTVVTWNVLAEMYATQEAFPHCDAYVLAWPYRRTRILNEMISTNADIVCLQEVQSEHFDDFFRPQLSLQGYEGVYKQKTKEIFTSGSGKRRGGKYTMDGCATFYKRDKFRVIENYALEFSRLIKEASNRSLPPELSLNPAVVQRLLKDNVALVLLLELNGCPPPSRQLVVANTHIVANPEANDVKIWQAQTLLGVLEQYMAEWSRRPDNPVSPSLVLVGDFNSTPDSAVYQLMASGDCDRSHEDLTTDRFGLLADLHLGHSLSLKAAYSVSRMMSMGITSGSSSLFEPIFTNYTTSYAGCLDYVFYSCDSLRLLSTRDVVDETVLQVEAHAQQLLDWALPSPVRPSDHLPLLAELQFL
eukprot:GHVS01094439.1.p1 GENE.GHVS01094439.1~~GHVS01094439.1.p1  ORF type:complete len:910 (+),score=145.14 GHVS01094439.1:283-3012(+)